MTELENRMQRDKLIDDYFNKGYACDIKEVYQAVVNTISDLEYANDEKQHKIDKALDYIDRLLYFGIRNEKVDLNEIKLYLTKPDYVDITLKNLESDDTVIRYENIEEYIESQLKENKNE